MNDEVVPWCRAAGLFVTRSRAYKKNDQAATSAAPAPRETCCHPGRGRFPGSMTKLVLLHKADSIYDDEPDKVYDFPRSYLKAMREAVGDWIVYYEPVKAGLRGYFAAAKISHVVEKPGAEGRFLALIEPGSFLPFDRPVPRLVERRPLEAALTEPTGCRRRAEPCSSRCAAFRKRTSRASWIWGCRPTSNIEGVRCGCGAENDDVPEALRPIIEGLTRRYYRGVAFRRSAQEVYGYRCAMSGLRLRNGGGRPEAQSAHIRPVEHEGSDSVRNELALSGTQHWMFDHGLLLVADDARTILVGHNKVPGRGCGPADLALR